MDGIFLKVEATPMTEIREAVQQAAELAAEIDVDVKLEFNGIELGISRADNDRKVDFVINEYYRLNEQRHINAPVWGDPNSLFNTCGKLKRFKMDNTGGVDKMVEAEDGEYFDCEAVLKLIEAMDDAPRTVVTNNVIGDADADNKIAILTRAFENLEGRVTKLTKDLEGRLFHVEHKDDLYGGKH